MIEHLVQQVILTGIASGAISDLNAENVMVAANGTQEWSDENKVWVTTGDVKSLIDMTTVTGDSGLYETEVTVACLAANYLEADLLRREIVEFLELYLDGQHDDQIVILGWVPGKVDSAPRFENGSFHDEYSAIKNFLILHT